MRALPVRSEHNGSSAHGLAAIGAHVVFGDIRPPSTPSPSPRVTFVPTDVAQYGDVLNLFREGWRRHGRVDHGIANAAVTETGQLFATGADDSAIEEAPPAAVLDVNARGAVFFARVAVHYLRKSRAARQGADASLLLVSSVAAINDSPGLFQYSASKHGVMGLFRSAHKYLWATEGIRVNVVLPNLTSGRLATPFPRGRDMQLTDEPPGTQMAAGVVAQHDAMGITSNEPRDVAHVFLHALTSGAHGESLYVSGGRTYEIEKKLEAVKPEWLGRPAYEELLACTEALGDVSGPRTGWGAGTDMLLMLGHQLDSR